LDLDREPFEPEGWSVAEHRQGGELKWDTSGIALYLSAAQQDGQKIEGDHIRRELNGKCPYNANLLDYLVSKPRLIPIQWKKERVFFWGTLYRHKNGYLCVRYLIRRKGR
jgi:hypothetical protein